MSVEVSISEEWLSDTGRAFPVTIDPTVETLNTTAGEGGFDTWVSNETAYINSSFATHPYLIVGSPTGANAYRSLLKFDLTGLPNGTGSQVVGSKLRLYNWYSLNCTPSAINVFGLGTSPAIGATNTWNSQPPVDGVAPSPSVSFARGASGCVPDWQDIDATALTRRWFAGTANNGMGLRATNEAAASYRGFYSAEQPGAFAPQLVVTYNRSPAAATPAGPADGVVLVEGTPTLMVNPASDPDGDEVSYWFRVGTGPYVEGGHSVDSGWIKPSDAGYVPCPAPDEANVCWTVPAGALADGFSRWHVFSSDRVNDTYFTTPPNDDNHRWSFRTTLRLGSGGPAPPTPSVRCRPTWPQATWRTPMPARVLPPWAATWGWASPTTRRLRPTACWASTTTAAPSRRPRPPRH